MKKSDSLPVQPVRGKKPVEPSSAFPFDKVPNKARRNEDHSPKKIWRKELDAHQSVNAGPVKSSDHDHEEGKYIPTEKPW